MSSRTLALCLFLLLFWCGQRAPALADDPSHFVDAAGEAVEQLVRSIMQEHTEPEALETEDAKERVASLVRTFREPLMAMPSELQTPENLQWYLDSVMFYLVEDTAPSSYLRIEAEFVHKTLPEEMMKAATDGFALMQTQGLTRDTVASFVQDYVDLSHEAANVIRNHLRTAGAVYVHRRVVPDFVTEPAGPFLSVQIPIGNLSGFYSPEAMEARRDRLEETLMAIYMDELIETMRQVSTQLFQFKMNSFFNLSFYLPNGIPDTSGAADTLRGLLEQELGREEIVLNEELEFLVWARLFTLAQDAYLSRESMPKLRPSGQSVAPAASPSSFLRLRYSDEGMTYPAPVP